MRSRRTPFVLAAVAALVLSSAPAASAAPPDHASRTTTVATYNLFLGGDIGSLLAPGIDTFAEFSAAATALYGQVVASDFPARAAAVADLVAEEQPDVVGLQEVATWTTTGGLPSYDFLAILLAALAAEGTPYEVVEANTNFVSPTIPLGGVTVQYTDRDVILARADLRTSELKVGATADHVFTAGIPLVLPFSATGGATTTATIVRGWSSADLKVRGKTVRFVNTHLEAFSAAVRNAQAAELAAALATSPYPVVLVGDLNADPGTGAVAILSSTLGLQDAWVVGTGPGYTAGQDDLRLATPTYDRRIDYVLLETDRSTPLRVVAAEVIGEEPGDRTSTPVPLWPSDHAGVVATLVIGWP